VNQRLVSGMSRALFDSDLIASRLALAFAELCWAIMLFWPGDSFVRPTYTEMAKVAPEWCWAWCFLFTSLIQLSIVAFDLCRTRGAWLFSGWNSLLWFTSVYLMIDAVQPPPAAIGGEIALTVSALWIFVRPLIIKRGEVRCAKQRQLAL
jgi:hypothetical protein